MGIILKYRDKKQKASVEKLVKVHFSLEIPRKKYYNKCKLDRFEKALVLLLLEKKEEIENLGKGI